MTVQSSARLSIAETASFYDWADPTKKSLLRGYDERSVLTEKRRAMVGDIGGGRRTGHVYRLDRHPVHAHEPALVNLETASSRTQSSDLERNVGRNLRLASHQQVVIQEFSHRW